MTGRVTKPPSEATVSRLRVLLERNTQAKTDTEQAKDDLYAAAYEAVKVEGAGLQQVADALGVGKSTVFGWVKKGAAHLKTTGSGG